MHLCGEVDQQPGDKKHDEDGDQRSAAFRGQRRHRHEGGKDDRDQAVPCDDRRDIQQRPHAPKETAHTEDDAANESEGDRAVDQHAGHR